MAPIIEPINTESAELGEGPHWDVDTQSLYYVDILGKSIHKYTPATKKYTKAVIGKFISIFFLNLIVSCAFSLPTLTNIGIQ